MLREILMLSDGSTDVNTVVFPTLRSRLFAQIWFMLNQKKQSSSVFTDPAANQTSSRVMLLREGVGVAPLSLPVSNRDLWISVCLFPWFLPSPVSWQSRLSAPRTGGNHATLPSSGAGAPIPCVYDAPFPYDLISNKLERWLSSAGGAGHALFSTITFRKPFWNKKREKKKIKKQIIEKAIFSQFPSHPARLAEKRCAMKRLILLWEMVEETQRRCSFALSSSLWRMSVIKQGRWGIWRELCVSAINRGAVSENTASNRPPASSLNTHSQTLSWKDAVKCVAMKIKRRVCMIHCGKKSAEIW